ncbi:hypothetical protein C6N34_009730 [Cylindrospermopsis raciborskii Cr2010]|uniref:transposase n=1 Tax=Cylindrospermopsis raciborskii TaxID=77022 RepID=UPI001F3761FB|nr:transposase [Cylindrospermopsis raciborskii]UJL32481.1 hypothetical protein C6N34_009730 [Cylindrospermopsis raciborskii Cr2010]
MFLDESGINLGMSRLFARSQDGQRAIGSVPGNKGKNISLIGALNPTFRTLSCDRSKRILM